MTTKNKGKQMTNKHEHIFTRSKPSASVEVCRCGKFRHTENASEPIVAVTKVIQHE